jgi:heat shock protein HslJ
MSAHGGLVLADARQLHFFPGAEKKATGYSGCNEFFGNYELKGEMLTFGPLGMTRRFCEGSAGDTESAFLQALGETRSWKAEKGMLLLLDSSTVLARFRTQ